MRASASLLLLLGRLRASLARAGPNQLMDQVAHALQQFEVDARAANAPADQIETAKYALAACADDIVQNLPNEDGRVWTQHSMLARFFKERMGGDRFFKELERAKQNPAVNLGVLEIMHACLSLGFEGVYRASGDRGAAQGDPAGSIRNHLPRSVEDDRGSFPALAGPGPPPLGQPSPGSRLGGRGACGSRSARLLPVSAQRPLRAQAETLALRMAEIHPAGELTIARETIVKPPPDPKPRTSTQLRAHPRGAGQGNRRRARSAPTQSATTIFIRIGNVVLFPPGGAKVSNAFAPIAAKIAAALDREPGAIHVDGYTDADPIHTVAFPSNFELSDGARQIGRGDAETEASRIPDASR